MAARERRERRPPLLRGEIEGGRAPSHTQPSTRHASATAGSRDNWLTLCPVAARRACTAVQQRRPSSDPFQTNGLTWALLRPGPLLYIHTGAMQQAA